MRFPHPLVHGTLIRRYKRFLADVRLDDGSEVMAHVANSGAMLGTSAPGMEVWLSPANSPTRKLAWSWELCRVDNALIGVNTAWPNLIAAEAVAAGQIPELTGYDTIRREVKYGQNSRIDLLLEAPGRPTCYVEVKNVHLKRGEWAEATKMPISIIMTIIAPAMFLWSNRPRQAPACSGSSRSPAEWIAIPGKTIRPA